jgi:outer membrane receptor protein involved in Fe transport
MPGGYWRGTGVLGWSRGPWSAGGTATYTSRYIGRYFPGGTYFNNGTINKPITLWDAQAGYDFGRAKWQPLSWARHLFADLRLSVNVYNLLNKEPGLDPVSKAPILGTVDPRGRRFLATLQKRF